MLVWARVCFLAILVKDWSNLGNWCLETQNFDNFVLEMAKNWQSWLRNPKSWDFWRRIQSSQRYHFEFVGGTSLPEIQPRAPTPLLNLGKEYRVNTEWARNLFPLLRIHSMKNTGSNQMNQQLTDSQEIEGDLVIFACHLIRTENVS